MKDVSELTGESIALPVSAWEKATHPVVPAIRDAMGSVAFLNQRSPDPVSVIELQRRVEQAWKLWHSSPQQRTDVGRLLPELIIQSHSCVRFAEAEQRRARAVAGDLYRLVQRLLAHISEPQLHALAVERGRAMSEGADTPLSLALAAWSSSVSLCASGEYSDAARLADLGADLVRPHLESGTVEIRGVYGALQLEAAAAHGLAGREGDSYRYLDAASRTARLLPPGYSHLPSAFDSYNVEILSVIVSTCLRKTGSAIRQASKINIGGVRSVVRRSRVLLETAQAKADRRDFTEAVVDLEAAAAVSLEAVALIPWARTLADELAECAPASIADRSSSLAARMKAAVLN
ncbi:hypothetical protein [Microlunatus sp. GCM10028923]|uniref:hypothetical protein n=1 Tax=Microlunatus sp. GCM10028923 TaxID=3273400 RepID=UPI003608A3D8